ncbi:MAG: hypothetical protein RI973_2377, partial [Bacteroidota bacterium]
TWTNISSGIPKGAFTRVVREDEVRRDLLFAGTETGLYLSWDGGKSWSPFQLNLPVTPITDLRVHQGDLIAATSGRSFWILDDLALLRQFRPAAGDFYIYQPEAAMLVNGRSEMDRSTADFSGAHPTRGVNPATGAVIYYQLPEDTVKQVLSLEVLDAKGRLVRSFSSQRDSTFRSYDGGPPAEPVLSTNKGLNRFVWDLRHATAPGVPDVYIESSYRGHKVPPGTYTLRLTRGDQQTSTVVEVLPNPLYSVDAAAYREYDSLMSGMEAELARMHQMVNALYAKSRQLEQLLGKLPTSGKQADLTAEGRALLSAMKQWDEDMVQRKSKAYDDVENYPNKFTANYLFLINHVESDIPRVNQPSRERLKELSAEWAVLESRVRALLDRDIPAFNKKLWDAGFGALWR